MLKQHLKHLFRSQKVYRLEKKNLETKCFVNFKASFILSALSKWPMDGNTFKWCGLLPNPVSGPDLEKVANGDNAIFRSF